MRIHLVRDLHDDEPPVLDAIPVEEEAPRSIETVWGLFEVLLKAPDRLEPFVRTKALQPRLAAGFAAITALGFGLYALALCVLFTFAPAGAIPALMSPGWDGSARGAAGLLAAYPLGLLLATLVVLPTYWYMGRLAGVRMPLLEVLTHSLKGKAATTVLVVGLLPLYAVLMLCLLLTGAPAELVRWGVVLGLVMPFVAGLRGAASIQAGFRRVVASTPELAGRRQQGRRQVIPGWLMFGWAALFTAVAPVVMYRAWDATTRLLGAA